MRRSWATVSLLAVAIALGLYLALVDTPRERAKSEQAELDAKVLSLQESDITSIEIVHQDRRLTLERAAGATWRLTAPRAAEADDGAVRRLLTQLTSLTVMRTIDPVAAPADLGLATPALRVKAVHAGGASSVAFGEANPSGSGVYVQRDDGRIFLTAASAQSTFEVSEDELRRKEFLTFDAGTVTRVTITKGRSTLHLERREGDWVMLDPIRAADPSKVSSLLSRLQAMRATVFLDTAEQRAALRLVPLPITRVDLTVGDRPMPVAFYQTADRKALYVRTEDEKLYGVNDRVLDEMPLDAAALRDMRLVRGPASDIRAVRVDLSSGGYAARRTESGWEVDGVAATKEVSDRLDQLADDLASLRGDSIASETRSRISGSALTDFAVRVTLSGSDDRALGSLVIGRPRNGRAYAISGSDGPVFWVAADVFSRIPDRTALLQGASPVPPPAPP